MKVYTTKGLVEANQLQVTDVVTMEDNARVIATEWRMGDEVVRKDVWVSVLRQHDMGSEQANLAG